MQLHDRQRPDASLPEKTIELTLTGAAHGGRCVGRHEGRVVFVPLGIPGETVEVALGRVRKRYAEGEIARVAAPSADRVAPPCPYYGTCGGCHLQHMAYERQLETKREVVRDLLERVGGFRGVTVHPTLPSPQPYGYRNTARFLGGRGGELGYTDRVRNAFLRVDRCPIMAPPISERLPTLQGLGVHRETVRLRLDERTGDVLVWPPLDEASRAGARHTTHEFLGHPFRVSATSFFQVNTPQAENLVRLAVERLRPLEGEVALDAYCGVGSFTRSLALEAARTIGIEESHSAVEDARQNLAGMRVRLIRGRTEEELHRLDDEISRVLLDPPRAGCESSALDALIALAPARIVYVSCEPSTLARDLAHLCGTGAYRLVDVQPVDMFPQTYHIEAVATLEAL